MKKLSIEEKAKRYDEAIEVAQRFYNNSVAITKKGLEDIFPELAESNDERIRKELLNAFQESEDSLYMVLTPHKRKLFIAWLEKQGEHANFRNKIQIGDKVTRNEDGVLVNLSQLNRVAKKQGEQILASSAKTCKDEQNPTKEHNVCDFCDEKHGCVSPCPTKLIEEQKPDIDQHSLPVSDNSSLPTFDESIYHPCTEEVCEQKPAGWSEEDEGFLNLLLAIFTNEHPNGVFTTDNITVFKGNYVTSNRIIEWLKNLKDKIQPQPKQEWSEEDEKMLKDAIRFCELCGNQVSANWLKSLRPQNRWKPTEGQMKSLKEACDEHWEPDGLDPLYTLWIQLKKLMEE